jgi:hypothetical protein
MKRLTYAPKVYAFIRSRQDGRIYDISDYIVSGQVTRNINQPSKAELVVKNSRFVLTPRGKQPRFLPMDGITIWLQRIAGHPIQVFTGYLDSVPYYQMYPGNATITASCTLKRLMYTFFDPGVPAMLEWFAKYGWAENPQTGMVLNPSNAFGGTVTDPSSSPTNDAGFGQLLFHFLNEISGWDSSAIMIGDLPRDLGKQAVKLWDSVQAGQQTAEQNLEAFLSKLLSIRVSHVNASNADSLGEVVNTLYKVASKSNIDPAVLVLAGLVMSGLRVDFLDEVETSPTFGAGLFDIPGTATSGAPQHDTPPSNTSGSGRFLYDGQSADSLLDPELSAKLFITRLKNALRDNEKTPTIESNYEDLGTWFAKAAGKDKYRASIAVAAKDNIAQAKKLVSTYSHSTTASTQLTVDPLTFSSLVNDVLPDHVTWDGVLTGQEASDAKVNLDMAQTLRNPILPYYLFVAHKFNLDLWSPSSRGLRVSHSGALPLSSTGRSAGDLLDYAKWAGGQADRVVYLDGDSKKVYGWQNGTAQSNLDYGVYTAANPKYGFEPGVVYVYTSEKSTKPTFLGRNSHVPSLTSSQNSPDDVNRFSFQDLVKIDMTAAFVSQFALPINFIESMLLTGDKSIMNDIPVLQGVQELCTASLREFMSLPSGEFCAFYPDYFGAMGRKPYWQITDLEITNMGIQLSDEPLATHVFVTGQTWAPGSVDQVINEFLTRGVVTIDKVFAAQNFIAGANKDGTLADAFEFLKIYGARPLKKDMPMIRSYWFEFLYAWQLFMLQWAAQFQTRVDMTFQPEIMTGGRVRFPDHKIEMYVQGVTHTFDYTSGFQTSATMIAPTTDEPGLYPGFALVGGNSGFGAMGDA